MRARNFAAIAAISLIASSSAAVAQSAQPLSLGNSPAARAGAASSGQSSLDRPGYGMYAAGAIILGLIIIGIAALSTENNDMPFSP